MASMTMAFSSPAGVSLAPPAAASSLTNRCQSVPMGGFARVKKCHSMGAHWAAGSQAAEFGCPRVGRRAESRRNFRGGGSRQVCVTASSSLGRLADAETIQFSEDGKGLPAAPGVYAVHDKEGKLQFVGMSRRLATSIQAHMQDLPELCGSVKVAVIDAPDKAALTQAWQQWIQEHIDTTGKPPPGNVGSSQWTARRSRAKPELKMMPSPDKKLNITLTELIDKVVKSTPVVAFIKGTRTQPQCGFSHRVLTLLNESQVNFEVVNVLDEYHNPGLREAIKSYSNWPTIPQLYVGGELVGGADIVTEMAEKGELKSLFKK